MFNRMHGLAITHPRRSPLSVFLPGTILLMLLGARALHASIDSKPHLQQRYDAAEEFQSKGDFEQASLQYKLFVADALDLLANQRAKIGDYTTASPWFEEAVQLDSNNINLRLDYAKAALAAKDFSKAESLAQQLVSAEPKNAKARLVLGRALLQAGQNAQA
jgi:cytochrome c-type biogenesis protein CcmH/NrfG